MTFLKKINLKNIKKFLWDYKYILVILLVLFIIYYYTNVYIQENLENNVSREQKKFALQVENTNDFDFNIQVYRLSYDTTSNTNSFTEIVQTTLIPAKKAVILPAGNDKFPEGFDANVYLDGGNLGFAVKVSTIDNSAKKIAYKLTYCSQEKVVSKQLCNRNAPNIGKFKELNTLNFMDASDKESVTISDAPNSTTKIYEITPVKDMNTYSIGFIYLPSMVITPSTTPASAPAKTVATKAVVVTAVPAAKAATTAATATIATTAAKGAATKAATAAKGAATAAKGAFKITKK
jgi:hypothetical protein